MVASFTLHSLLLDATNIPLSFMIKDYQIISEDFAQQFKDI